MTPKRMFMRVVFPEPLVPKSPTISLSPILNDKLFRIV